VCVCGAHKLELSPPQIMRAVYSGNLTCDQMPPSSTKSITDMFTYDWRTRPTKCCRLLFVERAEIQELPARYDECSSLTPEFGLPADSIRYTLDCAGWYGPDAYL
jgi:hypothetical protein